MFLFELALVHIGGQTGAVLAGHLLTRRAVLVQLHLDATHQETSLTVTLGHWALLLSVLVSLLLVSAWFASSVLELGLEGLLHGHAAVQGGGEGLLQRGVQRLAQDSDGSCLVQGTVLVDGGLVQVALHQTGISTATMATGLLLAIGRLGLLSLSGWGWVRVLGLAGGQGSLIDHGRGSSAALGGALKGRMKNECSCGALKGKELDAHHFGPVLEALLVELSSFARRLGRLGRGQCQGD